jgi:hypothetical protein
MKDVERLHQEAMELVDQAVVARQRGEVSAILGLARAAFAKERAAADLVAMQFDLEPTRSVLHRSTAVLALECSELRRRNGDRSRLTISDVPVSVQAPNQGFYLAQQLR